MLRRRDMRGNLGTIRGLGGNFMVVGRDEFFAELDGLTEKEIEARLTYGIRNSSHSFRNT